MVHEGWVGLGGLQNQPLGGIPSHVAAREAEEKRAFSLWLAAAQANNRVAQYSLGVVYEEGKLGTYTIMCAFELASQ